MFMLTYDFGVGTETGKLVVATARPPADMGASARGAAGTSLDLWVQFCAVADGGGEIVVASVADGVAAAIAGQLRYVSFFVLT
jgi:hypothetical protein